MAEESTPKIDTDDSAFRNGLARSGKRKALESMKVGEVLHTEDMGFQHLAYQRHERSSLRFTCRIRDGILHIKRIK